MIHFAIMIQIVILTQISPVFSVIYGYKRMSTPCMMENNVFLTQYTRSKVECASYCKGNVFGDCSRFMFDPIENKCMLHSETVFPGTTPVTITRQVNWDIHSVRDKDCNLPGYDYVDFINTCVKLYDDLSTTWEQASQICQNDTGHLITYETVAEWNFVSNYINCVTQKYWAGFRANQWVTGEPFVNIFGITVFVNNLPDSNNPEDPYYDCGVFNFNNAPEIVDVSCTMKVKNYFVCEIPIN